MSKTQIMNDEDYLQAIDLVDRLWSLDFQDMSKTQIMNDEDYLQALDLVDRLWSSDSPKDLECLDSLAEQIESYEALELDRILSTPNNERE